MSTTEERTLKWLNDNIDFFTRYRAEPINANRTAFYDEMIERQRTAISAIETCRQLKKSLFGEENVTNDELVRMVLQLKSGRCEDREGAETEESMIKLNDLSDDTLLVVYDDNLIPQVMTKETLAQKIKSGEMYRSEIFAYLAIKKPAVFTQNTIREWLDQLEDVYDQYPDWVDDMMTDLEMRDETKKFLALLNELSDLHMTYGSGERIEMEETETEEER